MLLLQRLTADEPSDAECAVSPPYETATVHASGQASTPKPTVRSSTELSAARGVSAEPQAPSTVRDCSEPPKPDGEECKPLSAERSEGDALADETDDDSEQSGGPSVIERPAPPNENTGVVSHAAPSEAC